VLVVDNAPDNKVARDIAAQFGALYVAEPVRGLSRARNTGARASRGDIIAYLDDDSLPEPHWLSALEREFNDPAVMIVTGRIISLPREAERLEEVPFASSPFPLGRRTIDCSVSEWFEMANFGGVGDGGNMALRRSAFDIWPGFDVRLGRGAPIGAGEEHCAFFSLIELGYRAIYTPDAMIGHPCPQTGSEKRAAALGHLCSTSANVTMLFFEQPSYRARLLRYIFGGMLGKRRVWRIYNDHPLRVISRYEATRAVFSGLVLYLKYGPNGKLSLQTAQTNGCLKSLTKNRGQAGLVAYAAVPDHGRRWD